MPQIAPIPGTGIDRRTGKVLAGWPHVQQSLDVIFTTVYGEREMRRWVGSFVPKLLGQNLAPSTVLKFWTAICVAIDRPASDGGEPRYRVSKILPKGSPDGMREGHLGFTIEGTYYPRGHLGDYSVSAPQTFNWP